MEIKVGDEITLNAVVVDVTQSGNAIVKLRKGGKILITPDEIKTIHPCKEISQIDLRRGN